MDEISMEIEKLLDAVHRSDEYQEYQKACHSAHLG